jgi:trehalose 6-phosphate synthase/phosphatase
MLAWLSRTSRSALLKKCRIACSRTCTSARTIFFISFSLNCGFTNRQLRAAIEEKHSSIVWHYRKADEEFGAWKANQLTEELSALTANHPVKVRFGKKMVEVTVAENNKGAAVARVLEQNDNYDVALCAGDDLTDESMFELSRPRLLTIKVGIGPTQARFRVSDPATFRQFLVSLFGD